MNHGLQLGCLAAITTLATTWLALAIPGPAQGGVSDTPTSYGATRHPGTASASPTVSATDELDLAEESLFTGDYEAALEHLRRAITAHPERTDYALLLQALSELGAGRPEEALETAASLRRQHRDSPWALRASAIDAEARLAQGDETAAAVVFRQTLDTLASPERRRALAQAYVVLADELERKTEGRPVTQNTPLGPTIFRLLENARTLAAFTRDETLALEERMIRLAVETPELHEPGIALARGVLERGGDPAIRLALGRMLAAKGEIGEALSLFRGLANSNPGSTYAAEALHRAAALFWRQPGEGDRATRIRCDNLEDYGHAVRLLDRLISEMPDQSLAVRARFERADLMASSGVAPLQAIDGFRSFAASHPGHDLAPLALLRAAELLASRGRGEEAIGIWKSFLAEHMTDAQWPEALKHLRDTHHAIASRLMAREEWAGAIATWKTFLAEHPQDDRAADAAWQLGDAMHRSGDDDGAIVQWRAVISRHPGSQEAAHAQFSIASILEKREQFEAALEAFAKVETEPWGARARRQIDAITKPSITIAVDRIFTTTEEAKVRIKSRNIERFEFVVHRVDVRDFFLKTHSTDGILSLEVAIAAPDHTEEHEIDSPERYRLHEQIVPLPFSEPGVAIVTARSGKLETSNAVIVTDLTFLGLLSRRAARIVALDASSGRPIESFDISVAADGRLIEDPGNLDRPSQASLLARAGFSDAFRDFDLSALPVMPKPKPVRRIWLDRTRYQAGDEVAALAIVREPEGAGLGIPANDYILEARAPNGLPYAQAGGRMSADGTLPLRFVLPEIYADGAWSVVLREKGRRDQEPVASAPLTVMTASPPPVWVSHAWSDPASPLWGQPFEIEVLVGAPSGRPARGLAIPWELRSGPVRLQGEARTDAAGRFSIAVAANPFLVSTARLDLTLPDQSQATHPLVIDVGRPALSLDIEGMPLGPVGWSRDLEVHCDPPRKAVTVVLTETDVSGLTRELRRETLSLDGDGKGGFSFTPREPGRYQVRVLTEDLRGLPVTVTKTLRAAVPGDAQDLFVEPAGSSAGPGETIDMRISSPEVMPGWIAILSDRVESVRSVTLARGWQTFSVRAPETRIEKFEVAVFGLSGKRLHQARITLDLEKKLVVNLVPATRSPRGGEEVTLSLRLSDEQGRPVTGQVCLVAGEERIDLPSADLFRQPWQGPYIAADASNRAGFAPISRTVQGQVLAALAQVEEMQEQDDEAGFAVYGFEPSRDRPRREQRLNDAIGTGGGAGGAYRGRYKARKGGGVAQTWHPPRHLMTRFGLVTDARGKASVRLRLPFARTTWHLQAFALTADRAGSTELDLAVRDSLTVITPQVVREDAPASIILIGEGTVDVEIAGRRETVELQPTSETSVEFTVPADRLDADAALPGVSPDRPWGEAEILVRSGALEETRRTPYVPAAGRRHPLAFGATDPRETIESLAARLLSTTDPAKRRRLARVCESAAVQSRKPMPLGDAVALALGLSSARDKGETIDEQSLAQVIGEADARLARRGEADARILRRTLLSMREALQTIQLVPFYRQRDRLSARALAWLSEMYRRLGRREEEEATRAAIDEAIAKKRLFEPIGVLDGEGTTYAFVRRLQGDVGGARSGVQRALSPLEAALWASLSEDGDSWETARRAETSAGTLPERRIVHAPSPVVGGRVVAPLTMGVILPRGFKPPSLEAVNAGDRFTVDVTFESPAGGAIEEPLPSGCRLVAAGGLAYDAKRHLLEGTIGKNPRTFTYTLQALTPGHDGLEVRTFDAPAADHPQEPAALAGLAMDSAAHKNWPAVLQHTSDLLAQARLGPPLAAPMASAAFLAAVKTEQQTAAVIYLEMLKETAGETSIERSDARFAARAYERAGEPLAAIDLYRSLGDELYLEDALLCGELDGLGKSNEALRWNERLLTSYPPSPLTREMLAALAQSLENAGRKRGKDALRVYRMRLALYPGAADQDEVTYALADLSIKQAAPSAAERIAAAALDHYPDSRLYEGFQLLRAIALYARKDYEQAAQAAAKMAAGSSGVAKLLGAQILHAQGKLDEALRAYREVADRFPDARRTVRFLERSGISIPRLTVVRTDEEAAVELQALGVGEVEIKLYEIDLSRLYVRAGGKVDLAGIEVAGFRPALEKTVRLARPASSARRRHMVPLEIEKPGAYYLTARAGSFSTTGLVIRSDLTMELQANAPAARAYVSDARANTAAPNVLVTFIARTSPPRIQTVRTDLRGIAEITDLRGPLSVVAQKDKMVALALLDQVVEEAPAQEGVPENALEEQLRKNRAILQDRNKYYNSNLQQRERRIQIKK